MTDLSGELNGVLIYNDYGFLMALIPGITLGILYALKIEGMIFNVGLIGSMLLMILADLKIRLNGEADSGLLAPTGGGMLMFIPTWMLGLFMIILNCSLWIRDAKEPMSNKLTNITFQGNYSPSQRVERALKALKLKGKVEAGSAGTFKVTLLVDAKAPRKDFEHTMAISLPTFVALKVDSLKVEFLSEGKVVEKGAFDMRTVASKAKEEKKNAGAYFVDFEPAKWYRKK
jgi:hypothetical protein